MLSQDRLRILVVDDMPDNIFVLRGILSEDYLIQATTKGESAILLAQSDTPPHLILLDVMMPEMDGYEVCRQLKDHPKTKDIPVIFVTAKNEVEDETMGLSLGAVDYITKPVNPPIVKARVRNHLKLKLQQDQLKESISLLQHNEEKLRQKAELGLQAGALAHDINNVLAGAMLVELMPDLITSNMEEKAQVQEYTQLVLESIKMGADICQGYTSYLKDVGCEAEVMPLAPLLKPIGMYRREFKGELNWDIQENTPPILCRGYQLKRVIINLYTNACQALKGQKKQQINIRLWAESKHVCLSIQDNGSGISEENICKIFKEGFSTKQSGTGLGLHMVKQIIENHQATIEVSSEEGVGTTFTMSFPAASKTSGPV